MLLATLWGPVTHRKLVMKAWTHLTNLHWKQLLLCKFADFLFWTHTTLQWKSLKNRRGGNLRFSKFHVIRMYDCFHTRLLCIERKGSKKPRDPCPKSLQTQLSSPWMRKACESLQDWIRAKQPSSSSLTSSSVYSFTLRMQSINNKDLPYSTGNYIQYPTMNHNGKEYEKEYICV